MLHSKTERLSRDLFRKYQDFTEQLLLRIIRGELDIPGAILAYELGSGKTIATLSALRIALDQFDISKVLVVANKLVAQTVWPEEINDWEHTHLSTFRLLRVEDDDEHVTKYANQAYAKAKAQQDGGFDRIRLQFISDGLSKSDARKRARKFCAKSSDYAGWVKMKEATRVKQAKLAHLAETDVEFHFINKENLPWLWDHFGRGARWPYDVMVVDDVREARSGKKYVKRGKDAPRNTPAQLTRFGVMAAARKHMRTVIELSGTPTPNGVEAMWGLSYIIDQGRRLGTGKTHFLKRWFDQDQYSYNIEPKSHAEREIMELCGDIMFSLDPKDLAELPRHMMPPEYPPIYVNLPDAIMEEYQRFRKTLVSELYDVEAVSKGVLTNKLLQFANGSMYQEDGNDIAIHELKLGALESLVDELNGEPVLISYNFKFDLVRLSKRYPKAVILNREKDVLNVIRRWSDGSIPMIFAHRQSAGHGLNMQHGGHHMVQYGLTHDLELYQQFNKRLHRPGQKNTVFNHHILTRGTIDERLISILADKASVQDSILRATRVEIERH